MSGVVAVPVAAQFICSWGDGKAVLQCQICHVAEDLELSLSSFPPSLPLLSLSLLYNYVSVQKASVSLNISSLHT